MRQFFSRALLLLAMCATAAQGADVSPDKVQLAARVHAIFEAKCVDCHGAELPRPKGKFGYVLDLERVAANPDWVVRGDAEASELYLLVASNEMPGEDADVPPLTPAELETVKEWIAAGAPSDLPPPPSGPTVATTAPAAAVPAINLPLWKKTIRWIGRFHPVSTHFPVALMFVAVLAEGFAWFTRRESWLQTVRFLVVLAALGAISATVLGWINAYFTSYVGDSAQILVWHRWLGTGSAVWAILCAGLIVMSRCQEGSPERQRFRGALLLGAALVGITGFLGSALIFGLDHYSWK